MKLKALMVGGCAVMALSIILAQAVAAMPLRFTFHLMPTCTWQKRPWLQTVEPLVMLGADLSGAMGGSPQSGPIVTMREEAMVAACHRVRGVHGDPRDLKVILTRWP